MAATVEYDGQQIVASFVVLLSKTSSYQFLLDVSNSKYRDIVVFTIKD